MEQEQKRGRGQPQKPDNEKKGVQKTVFFSKDQMTEIESAREKESPEKRIGAYIRDSAVAHAEKVNHATAKTNAPKPGKSTGKDLFD